jgi:hypothetical protein
VCDDKRKGGCGCRDIGLMAEAVRQMIVPSEVLGCITKQVPSDGSPITFDFHAQFAAVAVSVLSASTAASGGAVIGGSATAAAAAAGSASLPAGSSLTGFDIDCGPATAIVSGQVSVTGAGGSWTYELVETTSGGTLQVRYPNPVPANSSSAVPTVSVPAIVNGGAYTINVYGLTATTAAAAAQPLTLVAGTAAGDTAPTIGPGVAVVRANSGGVYNLRSNALTVYGGTPGDQVTVQAFTKPQRADWG